MSKDDQIYMDVILTVRGLLWCRLFGVGGLLGSDRRSCWRGSRCAGLGVFNLLLVFQTGERAGDGGEEGDDRLHNGRRSKDRRSIKEAQEEDDRIMGLRNLLLFTLALF